MVPSHWSSKAAQLAPQISQKHPRHISSLGMKLHPPFILLLPLPIQGSKHRIPAPRHCPLHIHSPKLLGSSPPSFWLKCTMFSPVMGLGMSGPLCPTCCPTSPLTLEVCGPWSLLQSQCKHHLLRAAFPVRRAFPLAPFIRLSVVQTLLSTLHTGSASTFLQARSVYAHILSVWDSTAHLGGRLYITSSSHCSWGDRASGKIYIE